MRQTELVKVAAQRVADIPSCLHLEPISDDLLQGDPSTAAFLSQLLDKRNYRDAVRVLAHALPSREAIWWACVCARQAAAGLMRGEDVRLLMAVECWVYTPTLENRALVSEAMCDADLTGPAAFVGSALASAQQHAQYPGTGPRAGDQLRGMAVAGAIILSAQYVDLQARPDTYIDFIRRGIDIAKGGSGS